MLYYLSIMFQDDIGPLRVLSYHTIRAGGAAMTAFLITLLIGPRVIEWLRMLKVGQYIRKEHVESLHELHKKKAGTPTMGGMLMLIATTITMLLWGRLENELLLIALAVFLGLGAVGFVDDYIKMKKKHNAGLSAKAKSVGIILVGLSLGVYLVYNPVTPDRSRITRADVRDWPRFVSVMFEELPGRFPELDEQLNGGPRTTPQDAADRDEMARAFSRAMAYVNLAPLAKEAQPPLTKDLQELLSGDPENLPRRDLQRMNRLLIEARYPGLLRGNIPDLHTKLEVPGLKQVFIPLGFYYAFFVLLVIYGSSNAVNLTDGLDGLAIGASIVSLLAYTAIAYVVSRADWSTYLYLVHVPEASELTVFGAALVGTGLGFLWYNCHPAQVFMGDTGSLALGGALGALAVLTKQELLLVLVGGLFVMEAGSVILQVGSFKLRKKRIFRMAPLHHHFELLGWSESKVTIRFWILALLFALASLATFKLR